MSRGRGSNFAKEETTALLHLRLEADPHFEGKHHTGSLWADIAYKLSQLGYPQRDGKAVRVRFNNERAAFKAHHKRLKQSGVAGQMPFPNEELWRSFPGLVASIDDFVSILQWSRDQSCLQSLWHLLSLWW